MDGDLRRRTKGADHTPPSADDILLDVQNFSLVLGGPLYQLLRRAHMTDDALALLRQRILVISLIAWLPLLVLSAIEGHLFGHAVALPFVFDLEVHIRFLVAMPVLIMAELVVHQRLRPIARTFLDRQIIPEAAVVRFDEAIRTAFRLRNSVVAELLLIALVYGVGIIVIWRQYIALQTTATWYGAPAPGGLALSPAGYWYGYVSVPIFQFLLIRWYFRMFIWTRFLWQVSCIPLNLVPTHPDRVGGLGFLANTVYAFMPLLIAHGAMLAAQFANRIFFAGAKLTDFKIETASTVLFLLCLVFGPLLVFASQLAQAKRTGLREYGTLAERYVQEFDDKWLRGGAPADEPLVGSGDIQSLADLANSYDIVRTMRLAPITRDAVVSLAGSVLIPIAPLALTMMSLDDILKRLFGLMF
ncbi:hypothetical protein ACDA63_11780 [Uliginosibacterium sp. sgz301328]|uniref:hypothetical protein n=1 Tax=Uliginosibacterium sp. sgz301328 TaxID=3243764 RepID=UPI00359D9556